MKRLKKKVRNLFNMFMPDYVVFNRLKLPAAHLRTGGQEFLDNAYFVQSANQEVERLITNFQMSVNDSLLDIGCGFGRLAIGLLNKVPDVYYVGIDVNESAVHWCQSYVAREHPNFRFIHLDILNDRYNPTGKAINDHFQLPLPDEAFNIVYLYSVFSHMLPSDIKGYLREINRILISNGRLFFTAFSEPNVPEMTINPPNYQNVEWEAPLHCVRYNHSFLLGLLTTQGFQLDSFVYAQETEGQSAFYMSKQSE